MAPPKKYSLDEEYFNKIDTPEKAYWLGFITADGYVCQDRYLEVKLTATDEAHLRKLADALRTDRPIYKQPAHGNSKSAVRLQAYSVHLTRALEDLGVTQAKSLTVQPWRGPGELMRYYWRGLFDGDGSIGIYCTEWAAQIAGSLHCVQGFADWAKIITNSRAAPRSRGNYWIWQIRGNRQVPSLAKVLSLHEKFSLERKQLLLESSFS